MLRGGTLMPIGNFPEVLSQRILAGIILVGRLGVDDDGKMAEPGTGRKASTRRARSSTSSAGRRPGGRRGQGVVAGASKCN